MGNERTDLILGDGTSLDSLPKWLRDQIDYNNEIAGRETGRAKRFLTSSRDDDPDSQKKKDERHFNALMRLLQDPNYARLYREAANVITDAEDAVTRALRKLSDKGEEVAQRIKALKDAAAELPDGRKVFRSKDGRLLTEDGKDVSDQRGHVKGSLDSAPSWEEFQRAKETLEDIERRKRELEHYQREVLDPYKQRLSDPDDPPSKDELEEMMHKAKAAMLEDALAEMKSRGAANTASAPNTSAADQYVQAAELNAPDLEAHFRAAASAAPENPFASPKAAITPKTV